jgi:hypothetical protein
MIEVTIAIQAMVPETASDAYRACDDDRKFPGFSGNRVIILVKYAYMGLNSAPRGAHAVSRIRCDSCGTRAQVKETRRETPEKRGSLEVSLQGLSDCRGEGVARAQKVDP